MWSSRWLPILLFLVLALAIRPSRAQTSQRDDLSATGSFPLPEEPSLEKSDFVAAPNPPDRSLRSVGMIPEARGRTLSRALRRPVIAPDTVSNSGLFAPIALGITGGTFGFFAGAATGSAIAEASACDSWGCGLGYPILGAVAGEAAGLSSGVYLGTDRRGRYLVTLAVGSISALVGLALVNATDSPVALLGVPVLQLAVTIPAARSGE